MGVYQVQCGKLALLHALRYMQMLSVICRALFDAVHTVYECRA